MTDVLCGSDPMKDSDETPGLPKELQNTEAHDVIMKPLLPFFEAIDEIFQNISDEALDAPRTFLQKMEQSLNDAGQRVKFDAPPEQVAKSFSDFMLNSIPRIPDMVQGISELLKTKLLAEFATSPAYHSLDKLVRDAANVSLKDCRTALGKIERDKLYKDIHLANAELYGAEKKAGEPRAKAALKAISVISETLYQPYLRTLLRLFRVVKGIQIDVLPKAYGQVLNELLDKGTFVAAYPHLVDSDAVLARNADAHNRWDYFYKTDEIELRDQSSAPKRLSVTEIIERARSMLRLSGRLLPDYTVLWTIDLSISYFTGPQGQQLKDHLTKTLQDHIAAADEK